MNPSSRPEVIGAQAPVPPAMSAEAELYVGLMSGTSLDGVDGVLVDFGPANCRTIRLLGHVHQAFQGPLRDELMALNQRGDDEVHRVALAANQLAHCYGTVVHRLLTAHGLQPSQVRAIGAHGQTIRHRPLEFDGTGYTVQVMNGALLAEVSGIDVVCDFRSRDIAAGGQGAPLVPAFHQAYFSSTSADIAVVNIGGMANLSCLFRNTALTGFDAGPGNVLMDLWIQRHRGASYDEAGRWAASGRVIDGLLATALSEPYFQRQGPKSTGRDQFHLAWLIDVLHRWEDQTGTVLRPEDVQATLCELTAATIAQALTSEIPEATHLLVCGGGAHNTHLMAALARRLPNQQVIDTANAAGADPMHVEAEAFAWLARAHIHRQTANCPAVTGSTGQRILGALYPA